MIIGVAFDETTRSFSVVEDTKEFGKVKDTLHRGMERVRELGSSAKSHVKKHDRAYLAGAAGVAGAGTGVLLAKRKAKAEAAAKGLEPGTPAYRKFMAKKMAVAGAIGAVVGVVGADLTRSSVQAIKGRKAAGGLMKSAKAVGKANYVTPVTNVVTSIRGKFKK